MNGLGYLPLIKRIPIQQGYGSIWWIHTCTGVKMCMCVCMFVCVFVSYCLFVLMQIFNWHTPNKNGRFSSWKYLKMITSMVLGTCEGQWYMTCVYILPVWPEYMGTTNRIESLGETPAIYHHNGSAVGGFNSENTIYSYSTNHFYGGKQKLFETTSQFQSQGLGWSPVNVATLSLAHGESGHRYVHRWSYGTAASSAKTEMYPLPEIYERLISWIIQPVNTWFYTM